MTGLTTGWENVTVQVPVASNKPTRSVRDGALSTIVPSAYVEDGSQ
jgi:hypothetical protein